MKLKIAFLMISLILFFSICVPLISQDRKMSTGLGAEWNMNARSNFAGGAASGFLFNLPGNSAIGITVTASTVFWGFEIIEPTFLVRYYFQKMPYSGFYGQFDFGPFFYIEDGASNYYFELGVRAGYRLLLGSLFYIEPYGRLGFPLAFGIGASMGVRF